MRQTAATLLVFFLFLFAYTKLAGPIPFSVTSVTTQKTDTFSVTGEGKIAIKPDMAQVMVGVTVNGASVREVQSDLNSKINQVTEAIKKLGIEGKDIQTASYNIYPNYDYRESGSRITGYNANTNLTIKVRDIDKINSVIDAASGSGANQVGGISFDVDDKTKAQNEARTRAVEEAKKKANEAAKIAGFKLGKIINYSETFGGEPRPIPLAAREAGGGVPTQVEPGSAEISVQVTLTYQIE